MGSEGRAAARQPASNDDTAGRAQTAGPATELAVERISATKVLIAGRELTAFSGCGYLGLAQHPELVAVATRELAAHGLGVAASRTTSGTSAAHVELEDALARFVEKPAALLAADGYLSNLLAAQALSAQIELALVMAGSHVSVLDAVNATFPQRATVRSVHDVRVAVNAASGRNCALFTDGLFASARRLAPLAELVALLDDPAEELAALVVDDAHGVGVLGARGRGTCEHAGVAHERLIVTGTLSKALGSFGGFIAGSERLVANARAHAQAYAGATPIPSAYARAALAALSIVEREPQRLARLRAAIARVRAGFARLNLPVSEFENPVFAFAPPAPHDTARVHAALLRDGFFVPDVEYPDGLGRYLRLALCSEHDAGTLDALLASLERALGRA